MTPPAPALTSRNNLASAYVVAEEPGKAAALFEQVAADRERVLGADHPDTLSTRETLTTLGATKRKGWWRK